MSICQVNLCPRPAVTTYPGFMCDVHRQEWLTWRDEQLHPAQVVSGR